MNHAMLSRKSATGLTSKAMVASEPANKGPRIEAQVAAGVEMENAGSSFGSPLPEDVRTFMETRFHHSFSSIRIHTGSDAEASARALNADAYTIGNRVVFGAGQYQPNTATGRRLIAHELSHTLQQARESHNGAASLVLGELGESLEQQADRAADAVMAGSRPPTLTRTPLRIQRQAKEANTTTANLVSAKIPINMLSDLYGTPGAFKVASLKKGTLLRVEGPHPQSAGLALWVTVMKNAAEPADLPRGVVNKAWVEPAKIPVSPCALTLTITPVPSDKAAESVAEDPDALRLKNIEAQIVDLQKELDDPKPLSPHKVALADQISFLRKDASTLRKKLGLPEKGQEPKPTVSWVLPSEISGGSRLTTDQKVKLQPALAEGFSIIIDGKKFELTPPPKGKFAMDVRNLKRLLVYAKERAQAAYAHQQKMMEDRGVAGRASEMWGQALAPDASLLLEVVKFADAGLKALQEGGENSIPSAQDDLKRAEDWLREYAHSWARYLNKVQAGGEKLAEDIKTGAIVAISIITAPAGGAGAIIGAVATTGIEVADRFASGKDIKWGELSIDMIVPILVSAIFSRFGGKATEEIIENLVKSGAAKNLAKAAVMQLVKNEYLREVTVIVQSLVKSLTAAKPGQIINQELFLNEVEKSLFDLQAITTNAVISLVSTGGPRPQGSPTLDALKKKVAVAGLSLKLSLGNVSPEHQPVGSRSPEAVQAAPHSSEPPSASRPTVPEATQAPRAPAEAQPAKGPPKLNEPLGKGSSKPPKSLEPLSASEKGSEAETPAEPEAQPKPRSAEAGEAPGRKTPRPGEQDKKLQPESLEPGAKVTEPPKKTQETRRDAGREEAAAPPKLRVAKAGEPLLTKNKKSVVIALEDDPVVLDAAQSLIEFGELPEGSVIAVVHGSTKGKFLLGGLREELAAQFGPQLRQARDFLKASGGEPKRGVLAMCGGGRGTTPKHEQGVRATTAIAASELGLHVIGYKVKVAVAVEDAVGKIVGAGGKANPPRRVDLPVVQSEAERAATKAPTTPEAEAGTPKFGGPAKTDEPLSAPAGAAPSEKEPVIVRFGKAEVDELVRFWEKKIKSTKDPGLSKQYQSAIDLLKRRGRIRFKPDFNQSEEEITHLYSLIGGEAQKAYVQGREARVGEQATRPDITMPNVLVEVKNWNVIQINDPAKAHQMLRSMAKQISARRTHGPANIKSQSIVLDIRGQKASDDILRSLGETFAERSGLPIENIQIVVWEESPGPPPASGESAATASKTGTRERGAKLEPLSAPEDPAAKPTPEAGEEPATQAPAKEAATAEKKEGATSATGEIPVARNETRETAQTLVKQLRAANKEVIVNIGGVGETYEPQDAINLNPNEVAPRKHIPNHVKAGGEEISQFFEPGQVDRVVGHRLSHGLDWDQIAHGSFQVLKPGGKFFLTFRWAHPEGAKKLVNALTKAGFENARSGEAVIAAEKPGAAGGEPAAGKAGPPVSEEPPKSLKPPSAAEHAPETKPTQAQGIKAPEAAESPAAKRATEEPAPKPGSEPAPAKAGEPAPASAAKASDPLPELATSQTGRKFSDLEMTRTRIEEPEGLDPGQRSKPVDAPNMDAVRASLKQEGVALVREPGLSQRKAASATTMYIRVTGPEGSSFDRAAIRFDPNRGVLQDLKHEMNHVMDYRTGKMPPDTVTAQDAKQFAELQAKPPEELLAIAESMPRPKKPPIENAKQLLREEVAEVRNNLRDVESLPSLKAGYVKTSKAVAQAKYLRLEHFVKTGFGGQLNEVQRLEAKEYVRQFIETSFPELREAFATAFPERKDAWKFLE